MCLTSKSKFCPIRNHVQKNEINSAVSPTQSVVIDHNDVLLSVSFLSRINFRVAVGITEASETPVVYKAFSRLVWRANVFGLVKEREERSACLSRNESSHGKQLTLHRVFSSSVLSHSLLTTLLSTTSSWVRLTVAPVMKTERGKFRHENLREEKFRHDCLRDSEKHRIILYLNKLWRTSKLSNFVCTWGFCSTPAKSSSVRVVHSKRELPI